MDETQMLALMKALDAGSNMFGKLSPDIRARLYAVAENPTSETWADAHGIVVGGGGLMGGKTLWQSLLRHTDYDVRRGPSTGMGEETVWPDEMLPTTEQILTAISTTLRADTEQGA